MDRSRRVYSLLGIIVGPLVVILSVVSYYFIVGYKVKEEKEIFQVEVPN